MLAGILFLGIVIPPGAWAVRLAKIEATPLTRLAMALGIGIPVALTLLLLELQIGGPWLLLPFVAVATVMSRPGLKHVAEARTIAPDLVVPALLAGLALWVNAGDLSLDPAAFSARTGFDVSDRTFYAMVAQELERAPVDRIENPAFAGLHLQYSYLPSLAAVLLHRYAGVSALRACTTHLPAFGLAFTGLAAAALAQSLGARKLSSRALAAVLVALGGDLSFLVPHINDTWLERTRHFFVFYSFSSEVLFYNPWAFGVPLTMAAVLWFVECRRSSSVWTLLACSAAVAALYETKVFAFAPLWLAVLVLGSLERDKRTLALAALSLALVSPAVALTLASGGSQRGLPLRWAPFAFVEDSIAANPSLTELAARAGFPMAALAVVAGGFGLRLLGLPRLVGLARDGDAAPRLLAALIAAAMLLALTFEGVPTRLDGAQFLVLPLALSWLFAGSAIHDNLGRGPGRRVVVVMAVALAVITPTRYVTLKRFPDLFTAPGAVDRLRFTLSPTTVEACEWLRSHSGPLERIVLPLEGDPEDRGGLKPLYVAALSGRRIVAEPVAYHVGPEVETARSLAVERLYSTADPAEGERVLIDLGVRWLWVDAARPVHFESRHLEPRAVFGRTLLLHFTRP